MYIQIYRGVGAGLFIFLIIAEMVGEPAPTA